MERRVRDQQLEVVCGGSRLATLCPDPITTTVGFEAARLARAVYAEYIDKPFAFRGVHIGKSFTGLDDSTASWEWQQRCGGKILGVAPSYIKV